MSISNQAQGLKAGVCTSTTRPTTPYAGQTIFETDTKNELTWDGSAWSKPWNMPWGFVAQETLVGSLSYITTAQDVLAITFNSIANRRYRYTINGLLVSDNTGAFNILFTNASNTSLREYFTYFASSSNAYQMGFIDYTETFSTSGYVTRKIRHTASTMGVFYYGSSVRDSIAWKIRVEDIGPA